MTGESIYFARNDPLLPIGRFRGDWRVWSETAGICLECDSTNVEMIEVFEDGGNVRCQKMICHDCKAFGLSEGC
jgi:hypothetical protein